MNNNNTEFQDNYAVEPDTKDNDLKSKNKSSFLKELFDYFELFIISACAVLVLFSFVTRICRVDGTSMLNTLHDGEMLIVSDILYTPERGDVIVFHQTGTMNEPVVKRVIATEGEWLSIVPADNRTLTITIYDENKENPQVLNEDYANYSEGVGLYRYNGEIFQVPDGCIFALGDNRGNSTDSRSSLIGFVDTRRILGKVIFRLTPLNKMGFIK